MTKDFFMMFHSFEDKPMGAVSAFTDRNLSLPTSEQLLLVKMVLEPFLLAWMELEPLLLAQMELEQLLLAWMAIGAVASCLDGVLLCLL